MVKIVAVAPGSIAEELELQPGDALVAINGKPLRDLIDYLLLTKNAEELCLEVLCADGTALEPELEKDAEEDLGLEIEHPAPTQCGNDCLFCFVHQLPRGMRNTLYIKDEDYRFSFLYGAYVTLSNIREEEIVRILEQRLSPLYVSVHTTDAGLRSQLLGRKQIPPILDLLRRLIAGGIEIHTQVVVCPGINDGTGLEQTITDLGELVPGLLSLALVPVGLTGHRDRLPQLRLHTQDEARAILELVRRRQAQFLLKFGRRLVFAADEFYLQGASEFPLLEEYEGLPQYENGVGMIPLFRQEAKQVLEEAQSLPSFTVDCLTGASFWSELVDFSRKLEVRTGVKIQVHKVENHFFGGHVSVTGLLTGRDIIESLRGRLTGKVLLVPEVVFRDGEEVLLDDVTPEELAEALAVEIFPIAATPWGMLHALEAIATEYSDSIS